MSDGGAAAPDGENNDGSSRGRGENPASPISRAEDQPAHTHDQPWVGVVANASSGRGKGRITVGRFIRELRHHGLKARVAWTPEERTALVAESSKEPGCRCLVAVGGDGTIGALVNEIPRVPISVLPAGTENLFARHFRLKRDPAAAAATVAAGRRLTIDLGMSPGRRFTLMAGFGFDADVVTRHHTARVRGGTSRPTNRAMYVEPVLRASLRYKFPQITVRTTDPTTEAEETIVGTTVFVFNLPSYALNLPFAPSAVGDDGLLDVVVFRDPGPFRALHYLWLVVRGLHLDRPGVEHRKVRKAVVTASELIPVQLDGDPAGYVNGAPGSAWTTEVLPAAVDILIPPAKK